LKTIEDPLEELMTVWKQHYERIDQMAKSHALSQVNLVPRHSFFSPRWRKMLSGSAMTILSVVIIVGMVLLRKHYVVDIFDLIFFMLLALILFLSTVQGIMQFIKYFRLQAFKPSNFHAFRSAAVCAAAVVMFIFLYFPVQGGRATSLTSLSQRDETLIQVTNTLSNINKL